MIRIISIIISFLSLISCSSSLNLRTLEETNINPKKIYIDGNKKLLNSNYNDAIKIFDFLNNHYPFSIYAKKSNLEIIYAYYLSNQIMLSISSAERYIQLYPNDKYTDYAYYILGILHFNYSMGFLQKYFPYKIEYHNMNKNYFLAYKNFKKLLNIYPTSIYNEDAKRRIIFMMNNIAHYEYLIANYYYKCGAYIAALQRLKKILIYFPQSIFIKDALILSIKIYKKLGILNLAKSTYKVLKLNYPYEAKFISLH